LDSGVIAGAKLVAVTSGDLSKAKLFCGELSCAPVVTTLEDLCQRSEIVIECATAMAFPHIARCALNAGKSLIVVSSAGIPNCPEFLTLAAQSGSRVRIASGALPGLDSIRSAAEGRLKRVRLTSTVLPSSFTAEPTVKALAIDLLNPPQERLLIFRGSALEAASAFPRHFNVAIALNLAGVPIELIEVELWMDARMEGPTVKIEVDSEDVNLTMMSRNLPSIDNPRTSRIVAPSVLAALLGMLGSVQAGS
jgi:aspartate dehydrogenase